jgi:uncharacterized membrane protein YeaQ/YmgE (transglycosylase-associated protein family)
MTIPAFLLGSSVSILTGAIFHVWKGGGLARLLLDLILSWVGFFLGNFLASRFKLNILDIGPLHFGFAFLGSIILLFLGHWLSLSRAEKNA